MTIKRLASEMNDNDSGIWHLSTKHPPYHGISKTKPRNGLRNSNSGLVMTFAPKLTALQVVDSTSQKSKMGDYRQAAVVIITGR